jgi:alkanesulfonate monooxygenase SsuD/methylene tetrahydromethanopterin reductase-like flavin-dependent oxidoreductase (luciferase family)
MTRQVNFGLWYDFRNPAPWAVPFERLYADALDQIADAEQLGFQSTWITEHHFCADGYTPSPLVMAAAIGARTRRMRIGTNLMILPLHNPVRIAEDAATLSLLTGGRFDLGVGIGYRELEFNEFGRQLNHRPSLMEEAVEIIRRAWRGERIRFEGKRFKVGDLNVTPVPEHAPKVYIGGMAEPAIDRVARIADGFLSTGGIGHDVYLECLKKHGKDPAAGTIIAGHWAIISDDPEREAAIVGPHALYQANQYIEWGAFGPPDQVPRFPDAKTAIAQGLYELWDGDTAVAKLTELLTRYPQIRDLHLWAQFPGEPVASGQRRIEYVARHVLPRVRKNLGLQD